MAGAPDEAKELRLVNNVELKIALADSDPKLYKLLGLYLTPLLMKLGSPHAAVRNKVIAVCSHVNTRIKHSDLLLPVPALLQQFQDPNIGGAHPLIRNFDLMYIMTGIDRIPVSERLELLPSLVKDISKHNNTHHQRTLFNILLRLLLHFKPPPRGSAEDTALREKLGFLESSRHHDAKWLSEWFAKLMLLDMGVFTGACSGLSTADVEFLTMGGEKETFMPFSVLADYKFAALRFVGSGAFTDAERYFVVLIASTDTGAATAEPADDVFKRAMSSVSLEDEEIVNRLYFLLLGDSEVPHTKLTLQIKILGLLSKSLKAIVDSKQKEIVDIFKLGLKTTHPKLRQAAFGFMGWVSRMSNDSLVHSLAPGAVEELRYWLLANTAASDDLRGYAYESLSLLTSRCVHIALEPQLDIIRFMFRQLKLDRGGVISSIEDALGVMLTKFAREKLNIQVKEALEDLLLEVIVEENRGVGQAVKWVGRLLGFGSVVGRWAATLAIGIGGTVAEEGGKALHPYYYRLVNPEVSIPTLANAESKMGIDRPTAEDKFGFPRFSQLILYFFSNNNSLPASFGSGINLVAGKLPPKSFAASLSFVKRIAIWEALGSEQQAEIKIDEDWDRNVDSIVETDEASRSLVEAFLAKQLEINPLVMTTLLDVAWEGMVYAGEGVGDVRNIWNDLAILVPQSVMSRYVPQLAVMQRLLASAKTESWRTAAFAVGLLGSYPMMGRSALAELMQALVVGLDAQQNSAFLSFGYISSRLKLRSTFECVDVELLKQGIGIIANTIVESKEMAVVEDAIVAFGELAVFNVVGKNPIDAEKIQKALVEKARRGDEKAAQCLGYLALLHPEDSKQCEDILKEVIKVGEEGGMEIAFVAGEALVNASAGWGSSAVRRGRMISGLEWSVGKRKGVKKLLDMLLDRANEPGGGGKRRITVVGLLSVFELCTEDEGVKERLSDAQEAFRGFLADRDEFIQESASRGLTAVYSLSDKNTQQKLVRSLVSSFTGETKQKIQVTRDTKLFEPGQLPTGKDTSVGSYGDIMSLAAELGDPSLVYKFMALARHNSIWASRAAFGRFGLGKILSGSIEVKDNEKLWPVLYRYRFDPSQGVRQSMDSIWQALGGSTETIERWWTAILRECLKSALRGNEWRVREASIGALADLLGGRKVSQYKEYLQDIWEIAFKVLDDLKESVRIAARRLCKVLAAGMVRAVEGDSGAKENVEVLEILMTFSMGRQGLEAEAKDVKLFALSTLLEVVKSAGEKLRPWIPDLVQKLLVILADVEPEVVNYFIMNADKYNTTGEDIDRIRLNSIRSSSIMSTIEDLLEKLDAPSTAKLVPQLIHSIKTSISLPAKFGCSRVVVNLVMRHPVSFKPYVDDVIKHLLTVIKDRSEVVAKSYMVALGYACRVASDQGLLRAVAWAQKNYWEGEERDRRAAGGAVAAVYKYATDRANALAVDILPFIFIAKYDTEDTVKEEFQKTWSDNTGGSGAVKLYLNEIAQLTAANIGSARWSTRQTCAFALAGAAKEIGIGITSQQLQILWPEMVTATAGKSWLGKEKVLEAFIGLAVAAKEHVNDEKLKEFVQIVIREAKRNNPRYRAQTIGSLGTFTDGFKGLDLFERIRGIVDNAIEAMNEDDMDVDGEDGQSSNQIKHTTLANCLQTLSQAFRPNLSPNDQINIQQVSYLLILIETHLPGAPRLLKSASINAISLVLTRLEEYKPNASDNEARWAPTLQRIWSRIVERATDRSFEESRIQASKALVPFSNVFKTRAGNSPALQEQVKADLGRLLAEEQAPMVLQFLRPFSEQLMTLVDSA